MSRGLGDVYKRQVWRKGDHLFLMEKAGAIILKWKSFHSARFGFCMRVISKWKMPVISKWKSYRIIIDFIRFMSAKLSFWNERIAPSFWYERRTLVLILRSPLSLWYERGNFSLIWCGTFSLRSGIFYPPPLAIKQTVIFPSFHSVNMNALLTHFQEKIHIKKRPSIFCKR